MPSLRICETCGSKVPPGTPRRRYETGLLGCPACKGVRDNASVSKSVHESSRTSQYMDRTATALNGAHYTDEDTHSDNPHFNALFKHLDGGYRLYDTGSNAIAIHHKAKGSNTYRHVGHLAWFGGKPRKKEDGSYDDSSNINGGVISGVRVNKNYQRKGLATEMLKFARERYPEQEIRHSHALTDDGRAWSEKVAVSLSKLEDAIRGALTDDLRREPYKGSENPLAGHCYVASEAYYHLNGGKAAGLVPMHINHEGHSHWWVRHPDGRHVDLTAEQFKTPVPYDEGRGKGFQTKEPSKRARELIRRLSHLAMREVDSSEDAFGGGASQSSHVGATADLLLDPRDAVRSSGRVGASQSERLQSVRTGGKCSIQRESSGRDQRSQTHESQAQSEHLVNPIDGSHDWFHGSPHEFGNFDEERPEEPDDGDYAPPQQHWNTHLGTHWTSLKDVANKFARGLHHNERGGELPKDSGGGVFTAHLGIKNPKVYKSEYDMDSEAFRDAWGKHEAHDPDNSHAAHCHDDGCYGLEEHEAGDPVDTAVRKHYETGVKGYKAMWLSSHPDAANIADDFKRKLQKKGHDGIVYGNELEGPKGHACAVPFDTEQIHHLTKTPYKTAKTAVESADLFGVKLAADGANRTGVMLALVPDATVSLALLDAYKGDNPEDMPNQHITLMYLGKTSDVEEDALRTFTEQWAREHEPLTGHVGGFAEFMNDNNVVVALWDIPGVEKWVADMKDRLSSMDITPGSDHGFTAHQTLGYEDDHQPIPKEVPDDASQDVTFNEIIMAYGGEWTRYKLGTGELVGSRTVGSLRSPHEVVKGGSMQTIAMTAQEREEAEEAEENNWSGRPNKLPENAAPGASDTDRVRSRHNRATPGVGDHVAVYRDLSGAPKSGFDPHDAFSMKRASAGGGRKPLVVAHTTGVHLTNVKPVFDEAARQKAMETGKRAVHAYTHGQVSRYIGPDEPKPQESQGWKRVNYYPDLGHFFMPDHGRVAFHGADEAILHHGQQFVRGNIKTGTESLPMSEHEPGGKFYKPKTSGLISRLFGSHDHDGWIVDGDFGRSAFMARVASKRDSIRTYAMQYIAHDSGDGETIYHCFDGNTRYITYDGIKTLAETVGTVQKVLVNTGAGGVWRDAMIHSFGEQSLLKVTLRRNQQIKIINATPEHRWLVRTRNDPMRKDSRIVTTADLKSGDPLAWLLPKSAIARSQPSTFGIARGIVFGDGVQTTQGCIVRLWGEKDAQLLRYFNDSVTYPEKTPNGVEGLRVCNLPNGWKQTPDLNESVSYLYGWLAGYFAADGSVSKQGQAILCSSSRSNLEFAQLVATRLGIGTYDIQTKSRTGYGQDPSGIHSIQFINSTLQSDFFLVLDHKLRYNAAIERNNPERLGWTIESVEDESLVEEVFCPRVEGENFVLDGWINTMNCPFCGSGQVIGRSDGTVECEFCNNHFTVQVQPEMGAMPQTIDGQPQQVPGMPGGPANDVPDPDADTDDDQMAMDPEDQDPDVDQDPDQDPDDADGGSQPPWLKGSSRMYLTESGGILDEDAFVRRLAIKHADDPRDVLQEIRAVNRA